MKMEESNLLWELGLLEDGLGDTVSYLNRGSGIRITLAQTGDRYLERPSHQSIRLIYPISPFEYNKRDTIEVFNFGGTNVPRVIADISVIEKVTPKEMKHVGHFYLPELDKWKMNDQGADFVYSGSNPIPFMLPNGMREIQNFSVWKNETDQVNKFPAFTLEEFKSVSLFFVMD